MPSKYVDRKLLVAKIGEAKTDIVEKLIKVNTEVFHKYYKHGVPCELVYIEHEDGYTFSFRETKHLGAQYYFYTTDFITDIELDNNDLEHIIISRTSALIKNLVLDIHPGRFTFVENYDVKREMKLMNEFYEKFQKKIVK